MANQNIILPAEVVNGGSLRQAPLNARFDQQLIAPNIQIGELRWVKPLLGDALYANFVADQVAAAQPPTVPKFNNVNYQVLWDLYLWSFTARAVTWASVGDIAIQIGANGLYLNNTDTSENAGTQGMKIKQDAIAQTLQVLAAEITKYLCANAALFPLFDESLNCGCGKKRSSQKLHVVLIPRSRRRFNCLNDCEEC